jgi:hypothetical protein
MQIQWLATLGLIAMVGAFVLADRAEAARRDPTLFGGAGQHHGRGMHVMMLLDSEIGNAVEAAWDGRDYGIRDISRYSGELHATFNGEPTQSYTATYMDEVAQRMGFSNGHLDLISVPVAQGGSYGLSVGGMGRGRSLLNMQWHLGP